MFCHLLNYNKTKRGYNYERLKKMESLKNLKIIATRLSRIYMAQSNKNVSEINCYHENEHDNSASHPDYHNDSHDNTPGRMMTRTLIKNATN